ncbi:MAG TPA: DUF5995 family protein [Acidimicrobiales bacterium]
MIGETAAELRAVALAAPDASGHFPAMYSVVTARIAAAIEEGRFEDGPRMDRFATTFARLYLRAHANRAEAARCWRATWDVAGDRRLLIVQHLLLGVNAHVNYDLARAVVEVAGPGGDLAAVRPDFEAVNDVLADTYSTVLRDLDRVSRWVNLAASMGGGRVFRFSLRVARDRAWDAAVRLHGLDEPGRRRYLAELDDLVAVLAYLVANPGPVPELAARLARRLEEQDPLVVTRALLGAGP